MNCLSCGKELVGRAKKYCNNQCQADHRYKVYIKNWKAGLENGMKGTYQLSGHIRRYLLEKTNHKCEKCGWGEINPYTNTLPLEIDHIDGSYQNNKEENLRVLCPNCHSLTSTYKGANKTGRTARSKYTTQDNSKVEVAEVAEPKFCIDCGVPVGSKAVRCVACSNITQRIVERPSREVLKKLVRTKSFVEIGKIYGVSDNAIRKWCVAEGIPSKKKDIKTYSDEEWALI